MGHVEPKRARLHCKLNSGGKNGRFSSTNRTFSGPEGRLARVQLEILFGIVFLGVCVQVFCISVILSMDHLDCSVKRGLAMTWITCASLLAPFCFPCSRTKRAHVETDLSAKVPELAGSLFSASCSVRAAPETFA